MFLDLRWMPETTMWLTSLGAVLSLAGISLGLFSMMTGKDHLPRRIRRLLPRVPASAEDHRTRGASLMLNGAAGMIFALGITLNVVAGANRVAFPRATLFFVEMVGLVVAWTCVLGSWSLHSRVRFVSTKSLADPRPAIPPA